jgi:hypothetical protein
MQVRDMEKVSEAGAKPVAHARAMVLITAFVLARAR